MSYDEISQKLEREQIRLASFGKRIAAFFIDEILISVLLLVIYWDKFLQVQTYQDIMVLISNLFFYIVLIKVIYHAFFVWYYGASIGKIVVKIACVDIELLDKPNLIKSLLRSVVRIFSESLFYLGYCWAFGNSARQTWQDKIANTVVIDVA
ncbi:MAG: RDD family protein [Campylobacter sp.]|nr:RDD family protein [Campylobacter sp.]